MLVLLHGLGGTWHIWRPVLKLLETRHRVIAVTLPGHHGGRVCDGPEQSSVAAIADRLIALLHAYGIDRAHVAGNSLGGWLALELARRNFALSAVALSPAGGWATAADYRAVIRPMRILFALMPLILLLSSFFLRYAWFRRLLGKKNMEHGDRVPEAEFRDLLRAAADTPVLPELLRAIVRDGHFAPMTASVPIRVAWSEHDRVIPFERYGRTMLAWVSGAEGTIVRGVGHVPMYDDPKQVAEQILALSDRLVVQTLDQTSAPT